MKSIYVLTSVTVSDVVSVLYTDKLLTKKQEFQNLKLLSERNHVKMK